MILELDKIVIITFKNITLHLYLSFIF